MSLGYAGTYQGLGKCPECHLVTNKPETMTDGKQLFLICKWCGARFLQDDPCHGQTCGSCNYPIDGCC